MLLLAEEYPDVINVLIVKKVNPGTGKQSRRSRSTVISFMLLGPLSVFQ